MNCPRVNCAWMSCFASCRVARPLLLLVCITAFWSRAWTADEHSLDHLMRQAILRNHDLKAARAQVQAALGRLQQAGLRPNPRIELSHDTDLLFGNNGEYAASVGVALDFPVTARLSRARDVARVDVASALAEVNEAERLLLGQVAASYYAALALNQKIALLDKLIALDDSLLKTAKKRFQLGEVSQLDSSAAAIELARQQQQRLALVAERRASLKTLESWLGYEFVDTSAMAGHMPEPAAPEALTTLLGRALAMRPELRLRALAADRANAEQLLAKATAWQDWTVSLGVRQDKLDIRGAPGQPSGRALLFTLAVPVPLFNKNQGTVAASRADAQSAQEQLAALRFRIQNDIAGKHEQLTLLFQAWRAFREQTLPLGRHNATLARDAYGKGQATMLEVVQAERQENELNTNYADSTAQYLQLHAALETASVRFADVMTHVTEPAAINPPQSTLPRQNRDNTNE